MILKKIYLIRLDDACPNMCTEKWDIIESILDEYNIKPLVGVVPNNLDQKLIIENADPKFWEKIKRWEEKEWDIALHGFDHQYISNEGGINPIWAKSEFAGVPIDVQKEKIQKGFKIIKSHNINAKFFFAPSHTFDNNTLLALREFSDIRIISDTIAFKPYNLNGFVIIPQQISAFKKVKLPGVWTICLHPNNMSEKEISKMRCFIRENRHKFSTFTKETTNINNKKTIADKIFSSIYFCRRSRKQKNITL